MKKNFSMKQIVFFYIIFVFLPISILALFSLRYALREGQFLQQQFNDSIATEIGQTATLVQKDLKDSEEELRAIMVGFFSKENSDKSLQTDGNNLIDIVFALDDSYKIIYPPEVSSYKEVEFFASNREFLLNRQQIPYFQNLAAIYAAEILQTESMELALSSAVEDRQAENEYDNSIMVEPQSQTFSKSKEVATNIATEKLQKNPDVKKQIRAKAESEGLVSSQMNYSYSVTPQSSMQQEESLIVSQNKFFSEIINSKVAGFIPRFVNDRLEIIFWCRLDDKIAGALLDRTKLQERVLSFFPEIENDKRIITLVDEFGYPHNFDRLSELSIEKNLPIATRDLSEIIPGWQIAAYLPDGSALQAQIRTRVATVAGGVIALMLSALAGAFMIIYFTGYQLKLAAKKTSFVANVSHELKTPLTTIRLYTEMLKDRRVSESNQQLYFQTILDEGKRLTSLINNVLDFSKLEKGAIISDLRTIELNQICSEIYTTFEMEFKSAGFEFSLNLPEEILFIKGNSDAVKQVLMNLLSNAKKYSDEQKSVHLNLYSKAEQVVIEVADRGIGIPEKYAQKVFKEFFRVDDSLTAKTNGTGLGLAISASIVQKLGGKISCHRREGGGTIFKIIFTESK
ncbi:MAG: HAMP domain-containing histidine kinase [Spirochaetales bacterium]|nr:HAMP domain-containing histidine kinase [Spirochaetales bacterium]